MLPSDCLCADAGHYIYLLETDNRAGLVAHIYTGYLNTTAKCLALFYTFLGVDQGTSLRVVAISEGKTNVLLSQMKQGEAVAGLTFTWSRHTVALPSGVHMLGIVGQRGKGARSGLSVDDIMVGDCAHVKCSVSSFLHECHVHATLLSDDNANAAATLLCY